MKEIIAFCGLPCHECGALLATQDDDDAKRAEVAQQWSKLFKVDIKPESINCDGCLSEGGQIFRDSMLMNHTRPDKNGMKQNIRLIAELRGSLLS